MIIIVARIRIYRCARRDSGIHLFIFQYIQRARAEQSIDTGAALIRTALISATCAALFRTAVILRGELGVRARLSRPFEQNWRVPNGGVPLLGV